MENPRCAIPMTVFWSGEFQVDQGSYIAAVVRAVNSKGPGEFSRWNVDGAFVEKVPSMMNPPTGVRDESSSNSVKLSWREMTAPRNGGSEIETYVLMYATTADLETDDWTYLLGDPADTADSIDTTWTNELMMVDASTYEYQHEGAEAEKLHYKIAARNRWGTGVFSKPNLEIDVASEPDQITNIKINDAGMVRITWIDPESSGSTLTRSYEVQLKNADGEW